MAWHVKPSATTQISTRPEPYLSEETKARYEAELIPRYEKRQGALLPILHEFQHEHHCIPHQAMVEIAAFLQIHPGEVLDVVSFYEEFTVDPTGTYVIAVCQSIACEVCGHQALVDHLRAKFGIEPHETTDDGKFTLLTLECLGACEGAPCALINDDRHDNLTIESLDELLEKLA